MAATPPILLIHGLWMTPRSWDTWAGRFRERGREVIVPGWPGVDDRSVAEIRRNPNPLKGVGLEQIVRHYEGIIHGFAQQPVIMGHSFGGLVTQLLADRGLGAAYVGIAAAATAGLKTTPFSTFRTALPIVANPLARNGAKPISKRHFHFTFGNDLTRAESDRIWEEFAINSTNRVMFEEVSSAGNEKTGVTRVDYARADRAPMLLITGELDHVTPPAIGRAAQAKYTATGSRAIVEHREYRGRTHRLLSQTGWEEIADAALAWADEHTEVEHAEVEHTE